MDIGRSSIRFVKTDFHIPAHLIDTVNKLVANFVWNGKKSKIKRDNVGF